MANMTQPTVMIVDDYEDVRNILRLWLEKHGCTVVDASGGSEAVEIAERERPDLILMDLSMPEIDGFAATFRIRQIEDLKDVPIIAISAYGELGIDVQLQIDPRAAGFNAYLPKPFAPEKLFTLVDQYLSGTRKAAGE
ncbi:MAG TPA: response regulator [Pyrinomonadaceae bacterium]|nr:response regulator [Pyrinomonadaceae bacterium]